MKHKNLSLAMAVLTFLFIVACDPNYFGRQLTRNSSIEPDDVTLTPIDVPDGADDSQDYFAVDATFNQPTEPELVNPDITFIMDTSASMDDERDALVDALEGWLLTLENNGFNNYCVGVMRAAFNGTNTGRLVTNGTNPRCLCRDQFSNAQIVTKFIENINSFNLSGGTEEAGILSYHNALNDQAKLDANQADGCFRNDMVQVPIFMADENDMGATVRNPSGGGGMNCGTVNLPASGGSVDLSAVTFDNSPFANLDGSFVTSPVTAPKYVSNNCNEAGVRYKFYSNNSATLEITPQTLVDDLIEYNGDLPSYGTGIIYNSTTFPQSSEESQGWGYSHFADILGFETANLATATPGTQAQFNNEMNQIADALTTALTAVRIFTLNPPVCPGLEDGLVVKVNGTTLTTPAQYTYNATTDKVKIKSGVTIPVGALMAFEYVSCE